MKIRINKEKNIGNVLFLVEGEKTEFSILKRIFCDIFEFSYIERKRDKDIRLINQKNKNSRVAVINTKSSNISSISDTEGYLDTIFEDLVKNNNYPIDKAAIYFLFDRDPLSNKNPDLIRTYINMLKNPYENDTSIRGGQLLLSFPSIEAFTISNFKNDTWKIKKGLGSELKEYISNNAKDIQLNKINEESLKKATFEFIKYVQNFEEIINIDEFSKTSLRIFETEEEFYKEKKLYDVFSMLVLAFLQLGLIEET